MRCVILETPQSIAFTKQAVLDCLVKGDAPLSFQMLNVVGFTPKETAACEQMLRQWQTTGAATMVVYTDQGITPQMQANIDAVALAGGTTEYRTMAVPVERA
jgi:hypothetical protein